MHTQSDLFDEKFNKTFESTRDMPNSTSRIPKLVPVNLTEQRPMTHHRSSTSRILKAKLVRNKMGSMDIRNLPSVTDDYSPEKKQSQHQTSHE